MPKRSKTRIPQHFGIKVLKNSHTEVTKERDPEDEWSGEDTDTSHDITGIEITEHGYDTDVTLTYLPSVEKEYYLLYGTYSTGDSFSHHTGKIFFIDLFENYEFAYKIRDIFSQPENAEKNDISYRREDGLFVQIHVPWVDYFGGLEGVHIERVRLGV